MNTKNALKLKSTFRVLAMAGLLGLSACGGGGGGSSSSSEMKVSGTAATGKALDGATVAVTCVAGSGSAVANAAGSYSVTITDGRGPCLLTATKGGTVLRSVTPGAGIANITPLTDILVNYLAARAGTTPESMLSSANGRAIIADTNALTAGQAAVVSYLQTTYGVTITSPNFLTVAITPPSGGTQSNSDKDLDGLAGKVVDSSGKVLGSVADAVKAIAEKAPYGAPTGATGGSAGSN
jgi:hypothetical protein